MLTWRVAAVGVLGTCATVGGVSRETDYDQRFAERVHLIRRYRRISQEELGLRAGMTRSAVIAVEQRKRGVRLGEAVRIAAALGVALVDLYSVEPLEMPERIRIG